MINKIWGLYKKYDQIVRYLFVGILSTIVNLVVKFVLLLFLLDAHNEIELQIAVIISWIVAVIFAYITNRKIVFKSKNDNLLNEVKNFFLARIVTLLLEMVFMWLLINFLGFNSDLGVFVVTCLVQFLVIVFNYIFSKLFVFKKRS